MHRLGIVDLGSNTARLVVYSYEPGNWYRLADQIREPVRLGEGLGRDGELTSQAQERARHALALFAEYAASTGLPKLEVLGTSAVRDATNREEFFERIRPLGLQVTVLSGEEEARLGVTAVANGFEFEDAWVMDLGGGSSQLSQMKKRRFVRGGALPLGAVRLTERFLQSDPPKAREIKRLEKYVARKLEPVVDRFRSQPVPLVAMGGTVRNLARAIQNEQEYPLPDRVHGYFLKRRDLEDLVDRLLELKEKARSRIPGIKSDRADVITAGALVYRWLLRAGELDGVWISGLGLREGAFMRHFLPEPHLITDLRSFSVQNLLHHYAQPKEHVAHTRHLASRLFDELKPLHGLGEREAYLLDAATVLQDIGLAVNYYRHDRHGAYLVSSAPLNGLTHREQGLLALLVRYHLRGKPRLGSVENLCGSGDQRLLYVLATCLRLADHLERPRSGRVRDVEIEITDKQVKLRPIAIETPTLELWEMEQHAELFESAFARQLVVG